MYIVHTFCDIEFEMFQFTAQTIVVFGVWGQEHHTVGEAAKVGQRVSVVGGTEASFVPPRKKYFWVKILG